MPVRWCAVQGSPQAEGKDPGERVSGTDLLDVVMDVNFNVFLSGALVLFVPADAPLGIPVIADPNPDDDQLGNIVISSFNSEFSQVIAYCEQGWSDLYPQQRGVILVNARVLIGAAVVGGAAPQVPFALWTASSTLLTGRRGDDLCGFPRNLTVADVSQMLKLVVYDPALFGTGNYFGDRYRPDIVLAHELGHVLMLPHGNGLDDNNDGLQPPFPGPRRFDEYCDPQALLEDSATPWTDCEGSGSLMQANSCTGLRPLQEEQIREVAKLVPGATFQGVAGPRAGSIVASVGACPADCPLPQDMTLVKVELSTTSADGVSSLLYTLLGPFRTSDETDYITYLDLDDNTRTGCDPSEVGLPDFQGADVLALVTVSGEGGTQEVRPTIWRCERNKFSQVRHPVIKAFAHTQFVQIDDETEIPISGIVSIHFPSSLLPANTNVRLQSVASRSGLGSDALPADMAGAIISMMAPELPKCILTPQVVRRGEEVTVRVRGLVSYRRVEVVFGTESVATANSDAHGTIFAKGVVPDDAPEGLLLVSVRVIDHPVTSTCAMVVAED